MPSIKQSEIVPYSAAQMFGLVNDVEAYPQFMPWCERAWVDARSESRIRAGLAVRKGKIHYCFTTDNDLTPCRRIDMRLVDGPFKKLHGIWQFADYQVGCRVSFDLDFEFANRLVGTALAPLFKIMTSSLVGSFRQRADSLYGRR